MDESGRQHQPVDPLEFKRRLLTCVASIPATADDPFAELARIVGAQGPDGSTDADALDGAILRGQAAVEALVARHPETHLETFQPPVSPTPAQPPYLVDLEPLANPHPDPNDSVSEELSGRESRTPYGNMDFLVAALGTAFPWLRDDGRRRNMRLAATVFAVAVAGILVILLNRPGASIRSPAEHHATAANLAQVPPADANSMPTTEPNSSAIQAVRADADAAGQPSSTKLPRPTSDAATAVAPTAAPANPSLASPNEILMLQPRRVHTVPVEGQGIQLTPDRFQAGVRE